MKILLSWLLDYLECSWTDIDIDRLVHLFNTRTAEIESYDRVTCDVSKFFMGRVVSKNNSIELLCPELAQTLSLPARTDVGVEKWYMVVQDQSAWRWATLSDFGSDKEGLMPALFVNANEEKGSWRQPIPSVDYLLDIDNKSINHRPDLWGHYGIAREIAAFLDISLKPLDSGLKKLEILSFPVSSKQHAGLDFSVTLQAEQACYRVAGLVCNDVQNQESSVWMAIRLARVGAKPMNAVVDISNYVMFDIGHPMHVFDAQAFPTHEMVARMAQVGEKLELLDGQNVSLNPADLVIANDQHPVSLAGIMGGKSSGFIATTKNIVLEAGGFNPAIIRKTAQRCKIRTEGSMRFEKHLDPMQNIIAIQRFVYLAQELAVLSKIDHPIISVGPVIEPKQCSLSHEFVQAKLGTVLQPEFIQKTLEKLGFGVQYESAKRSYIVTVPTYRMTKDVKIQEDLVEEIIRFYGFENLDAQLPMRATRPFSMQVIKNIDHIKRHLAYGLQMHEVRDYLLYDAAFVARLQMDLTHAVRVRNPLSQQWTTLVTSLVPHLVKSVETNIVGNQHLRFFECNRIWHATADKLVEQKSVAGIVFDKDNVDFYSVKAELQTLFDEFKLNVVWKKPTEQTLSVQTLSVQTLSGYYDRNQVAELYVNDQLLGFAGIISSAWMHKVVEGSAFVFELDGTMLEQLSVAQPRFKAWSKFQEVCYDISLFIPLRLTVDALKQAILSSDPLITTVELVDFFEKEEWNDQRAVTLRYVMSDAEKTMTKQEIDEIVQRVATAVVAHGAKIR